MRVRLIGVAVALLCLAFLASTACAGDGGGKGDKKRHEGEKVDLKDLPETVVLAAQKKASTAKWISAEKRTTKKLGVVYVLHGKVSNQTATLAINSSGEVLKFTEGSTRSGKIRPR